LSFARFQAGQFLDFVSASTIVGIAAENCNQFFECWNESGILFADRSESAARMRAWRGLKTLRP
jgi:hypothetical protein